MSLRHIRVVTICIALLLVASLSFILIVPTAVQHSAYGDDPDLSRALHSPELQAWQQRKAEKLVEIAELYAALEMGDKEVEERFPSLSHPLEGDNSALAGSKDPAEILEEALALDPANLGARIFLAELCVRRDARGTLTPNRRVWLQRTLDRLARTEIGANTQARLFSLVRAVESVLAEKTSERLAELRQWWTLHGDALRGECGEPFDGDSSPIR